mmetsp:Transcript_12195/g.36590  ORF Transcript_12195/g.36590 Transcript_12195/m.36590 type:complete len:233 (+) Transcript_12195:2170-2868(+)
MKCSVPSGRFSDMYLHPSPSKISPDCTALSTSLAPWSMIWPAPSALCPTSLLPISSSVGSPTAVPCAFTVHHLSGAPSRSLSMVGVSAWLIALSSATGASPQPSSTTSRNGWSFPGVLILSCGCREKSAFGSLGPSSAAGGPLSSVFCFLLSGDPIADAHTAEASQNVLIEDGVVPTVQPRAVWARLVLVRSSDAPQTPSRATSDHNEFVKIAMDVPNSEQGWNQQLSNPES